MVVWQRRLEEIIAESAGDKSPARLRREELYTLIKDQCREIIEEELQNFTADLLYKKIYVGDASKVHWDPALI